MTHRSPRFDYPASSEQIRLSLGILTFATEFQRCSGGAA
jgi:hypothetical protein